MLWSSSIRQELSTKEEVIKGGLSEKDFDDYIDFIKQLYGVYFVSNNYLALKYERFPAKMAMMDGIWEAFNDFCIDHRLIQEFADSAGDRMPVSFPSELERFQFIYSYPECPGVVHTCSIDEFRLAVEIVPAEPPDDTLYIHRGNIICNRNHHRVEQATAVLMDKNRKDIELNVSHCMNCSRFFLDYSSYRHYREKYGTILGNIYMTKNGEYSDDSFELADESPLRLCGYPVSQKAGLSQAERQTMIESCILSGAMTKSAAIHLLNWFIDVSGAKWGNELAMQKWTDDLDFTLALDTPRQARYRITKIERYHRNLFYCGTDKPPKAPTKEADPKPQISYLGKRVKHKSPH